MEIKMFWQPCRKCKKKRMNFDDVFHLTQRVQKVTSSDQFFKKKITAIFHILVSIQSLCNHCVSHTYRTSRFGMATFHMLRVHCG